MTGHNQDVTMSVMEKKLVKKKRKQRGGWPKRERAATSLRISPAIIEWYSQQADKAGRSRNVFIEMWLGVLKEVVETFEGDFERLTEANYKPEDEVRAELVDQMRAGLISRMAAMGVLTADINESYKFVRHYGV